MQFRDALARITLATLCAACSALGSMASESEPRLPISPSDPLSVPEDDPIFPALVAHQAAIEARYDEGKLVRPEFFPWKRVDSPAAATLFPGLRFASLAWNEGRRPGIEEVGLAFGLGETVAVAVESRGAGTDTSSARVVARLSHFGNYDEYGDLLAARRVRIRELRDAETVWAAFNELHGKRWARTVPVQQSPTLWTLHDTVIERVRYWFELRLDEAGFVVSGRLWAEIAESEKRSQSSNSPRQ